MRNVVQNLNQEQKINNNNNTHFILILRLDITFFKQASPRYFPRIQPKTTNYAIITNAQWESPKFTNNVRFVIGPVKVEKELKRNILNKLMIVLIMLKIPFRNQLVNFIESNFVNNKSMFYFTTLIANILFPINWLKGNDLISVFLPWFTKFVLEHFWIISIGFCSPIIKYNSTLIYFEVIWSFR